jgi:hypothetical protein
MTMAMAVHEGSAKIYQFPVGGRRGQTAARHEVTQVAAEAAATRLPKIVVGGSWYHEEAIQEAERAVKR